MLTKDEADKIQTLTEWRYVHSVCLERIEELKTRLAEVEQERDEWHSWADKHLTEKRRLLAENRQLKERIAELENHDG